MTNELLAEVSILRDKVEKYEQELKSAKLAIQCFKASAEMALEQNEKYKNAIEDIKSDIKAIQKEDLECDGCSDMGMVLDIIDEHIGG